MKITANNNRKKKRTDKAKCKKLLLRLYIAGQSSRAVSAIKNLKTICDEQMKSKYFVEVIDLLKNPKKGRDDQILAIPTLVCQHAHPVKYIIGDLSNTERVVAWLKLKRQIHKNIYR